METQNQTERTTKLPKPTTCGNKPQSTSMNTHYHYHKTITIITKITCAKIE
uniref:Uncharacterized protein n=1 Tax=Rhizophora mucronata TaxID=61149 RepID=A0A2P2QUE6_RHIMU